MKQWLITGANRVDGKPMRIVVRAQTERGAQDQAYELNMLIETLEDMSTLETPRARQVAATTNATNPAVDNHESAPRVREMNEWALKENASSATQPALGYEPVSGSDAKGGRSSFWIYTKESRRKRREQYLERGVNSVSEIAFGVFWGLFLFALALPVVVLIFLAFWMVIGEGLRGYS